MGRDKIIAHLGYSVPTHGAKEQFGNETWLGFRSVLPSCDQKNNCSFFQAESGIVDSTFCAVVALIALLSLITFYAVKKKLFILKTPLRKPQINIWFNLFYKIVKDSSHSNHRLFVLSTTAR